ncbi:Protein of unknown function [Gryllus bimaculatus]|nr:Protein of unknown function [Gryllus bimaculatus]
MFLALMTAWVPSFAPAGITNPFSSTTPSPPTANRPANGSIFNAIDGVPNGPEYGTMLHNLSLGPLPCSAAWPYLHRRDMGVCKQLWPPGAPLPQVRCDAVGGYRQIADTFTTLIHGM